MKNSSIFVASTPKTVMILLGAGFFISALLGARYNLGLPIPSGFCTVRSEIVFGETGIARPFSCAFYYDFSFMPKTMKDCATGNNSTRSATSAHETSIATVQSTVSNPYSIPCFSDLAEAVRRFDVECNAKNKAYAFILEQGLLSQFTQFCANESNDAHIDCITTLINGM